MLDPQVSKGKTTFKNLDKNNNAKFLQESFLNFTKGGYKTKTLS